MTEMTPAPVNIPVDAPGAMRAARNSLASLTRGVITVPLGLVVVALIKAGPGLGVLGLWGALSLLTSPMPPFTFGLHSSLIRQVACRAGDLAAQARVIGAGLRLYLGLDAGLAALYVVARGALIEHLAQWAGLAPAQVAVALDVSVSSYLLQLAGTPFVCFLLGREENPQAQACFTAGQVALAAGVFAAVKLRAGADLVLANTALANTALANRVWAATLFGTVVQVALQFAYAYRRAGFAPLTADPAGLYGTLMRESLSLTVLELAKLTFYHLDRWLVLIWLGGRYAGFYELGARLGLVFRALLNTLCASLMASAAVASTSAIATAKLRRLTYYSLRYLLALAVPISLFVVLEARRILELWVGATGPEPVTALAYLVPSYLLNAVAWAVLLPLVGRGRIRVAVRWGLISVGLNVLLDVAALALSGTFEAVLAASFAGSLLTALGLIAGRVREGLLDAPAVMRVIARLLIAAAIGVCAGALVLPAGTGRTAALGAFALHGAIAVALYLFLLVVLGEVDDQDRHFLRKFGGV